MLRTLRIRDFVIVRDLTVEFGPGLNLLTGETGAGKSILVDALGLVAGGRADRAWIRAGAERAVVEALFELDALAAARRRAAERGVEVAEGGQILVQRELPAAGGGKVWINGSPSTVQVLRDLGADLLELHGQHEQRSLLDGERQSDLLDEHGEHAAELEQVRAACRELRSSAERLDSLQRDAGRRGERVAELGRTVREIEAAAPRPGELDELERERRLLQSAATVSRLLDAIVEHAYEGEPSAASLAGAAADDADELARLDPTLAPLAERLRSAAIELADAGAELRDYRESRDFDPGRLEAIEARRAAIERLCLRHGVDESGLGELLGRSRRELAAIEGLESALAAAESERARAERAYVDAAEALGRARRAAAARLGPEVEGQLRVLALPQARFEVALRPVRGAAVELAGRDAVPISAAGAERAEFLLAANPGEPARPLGQIASGGELSRVMLALHVVAESGDDGRALVFDEVDAGVGGAVADAVGARLARLARRRQVLCVTHLPQVAAYADRHYLVRKRSAEGRTVAEVEDLTHERRVEELGRMLAGKRATDTSRRHAAELLSAARARPPVAARQGRRRE